MDKYFPSSEVSKKKLKPYDYEAKDPQHFISTNSKITSYIQGKKGEKRRWGEELITSYVQKLHPKLMAES
jgi:hypothetical protein